MIQVSLPVLVLIYVSALLTTVFGAWLLHEWRRQRREREAFRHVLRCTLCGCEFADASNAILPRCPNCGSLNERAQPSRP